MTIIIDYGAGNLLSVKKALDYIGSPCEISSEISKIKSADRLIMPGVGSFGDAMNSIKKKGLFDTLKTEAGSGKPFLGICLGLQILFSSSDEAPGAEGLGVLNGKISAFPKNMGLKVPHMGWNSIDIKSDNSRLFRGIPQGSYFYFVHSFYLNGADFADVAATADYGVKFQCAVEHGNLFATQFHPEKSGKIGLEVLKNFVTC